MHTPPSKHQNKLPLSLVVGFDIYATTPPSPGVPNHWPKKKAISKNLCQSILGRQ